MFDEYPSAQEGLGVFLLGSHGLYVVEDMGHESLNEMDNDERRVAVQIKEVWNYGRQDGSC
ncbi:MAG: hypothetical protein QG552_398 [Thermodesulfobacteriota bacterium]|nr:hypothetical protein [Thermodesulfobacteriota bacterium]